MTLVQEEVVQEKKKRVRAGSVDPRAPRRLQGCVQLAEDDEAG